MKLTKLAPFAVLLAVAACAVEATDAPSEQDVVSGEEALTAFPAASFAGATRINYGESTSRSYTAANGWVAVRFYGRAGEKVRFAVTATGNTVAHLVLGTNIVAARHLAGDPANSKRRTLTADGEYFVMMRTQDRAAATLRVALERLGGASSDAGAASNDSSPPDAGQRSDAGPQDAGGSGPAVPSGPIWGADGLPTCAGTIALPATGERRYSSGTRYSLWRSSSAAPWTQASATTITPIRVDSSGRLDLAMSLGMSSCSPGWGGWTGDCERGSAMLSSSGSASTSCNYFHDCQPFYGSSTAGHENFYRPVTIHAGASCTTITDVNPENPYKMTVIVQMY